MKRASGRARSRSSDNNTISSHGSGLPSSELVSTPHSPHDSRLAADQPGRFQLSYAHPVGDREYLYGNTATIPKATLIGLTQATCMALTVSTEAEGP